MSIVCDNVRMNTNAATSAPTSMFAVKITDGFERNTRIVGRYETKPEAIAAARYLKSKNAGAYCVAVPAPAVRPIWTPEDFAQTVRDARAVRSNVIAL